MSLTHRMLGVARKLFGNHTLTIRHGIAKGFKRRFGLGFVPKWSESKEDLFMREKDLTGQTVFDIGAYVGLYSLFFSHKVGQTGKVYSFEPNPLNFAELNHNLQLNGFHNTKTLMVAVGETPGKLEMVTSPYLTSRGSLDKEWQSHSGKEVQKFAVDVVTIDELVEMKELPKPDFIKIDVEAFELPVLKGMKKTLAKYHPTLLVEIHGPLTKELLEAISPHGYKVTHLELGEEVSPEHVPHVLHGHLYCEKKPHSKKE